MNQGIAFERTLRALQADDFRVSKLGLLAAALVIAAWVWWLVAARVPEYVSTDQVRIEHGSAFAYFPSTTGIRTGQPALIHANGVTIPARVQSIAADHVKLAVPASSQSPIAASSSPSVEIEVSQTSPASLALRILGYRPR